MNEALKLMSLGSRYTPSRRSISRIASATSLAASNITRAFHRLGVLLPASQRLSNKPMTAWVPARFPELNNTMTRSPRYSNTVILQNFEMLSTPAWVRESEANTNPRRALRQHHTSSRVSFNPCQSRERLLHSPVGSQVRDFSARFESDPMPAKCGDSDQCELTASL